MGHVSRFTVLVQGTPEMQFHTQVPGTSVNERQEFGNLYHFMACRTWCQRVSGCAIEGYDAALLYPG